MIVSIRMCNDQQNDAKDLPDRLPTLLAFDNAIWQAAMQRIAEHL